MNDDDPFPQLSRRIFLSTLSVSVPVVATACDDAARDGETFRDEQPPSNVAPPEPVRPLSTYDLPEGAIWVETTAELVAAWSSSTASDIVLADGVYEHDSHLSTRIPHRLWAQTLCGVTLRFGLAWGHPSLGAAGELHGLIIDVCTPTLVSPLSLINKALVLTWGACAGLLVEDCVLRGNGIIGAGIQAIQPEGLIVRRCEISDFLDHGILAHRNNTPGDGLSAPVVLEDLDITNIKRDVPGSSLGIAEVGIWLGHATNLSRFRVRDCAYSGVSIVNEAVDINIEDADIDRINFGYFQPGGQGIHMERGQSVHVNRAWIGPETVIGIGCEWNHDSNLPYQNSLVPANQLLFVRNTTILSYKIGLSLDISVALSHVAFSRFERAWRAGILDNNTFPDDEGGHPVPVGASPIQTTNAVDFASCEFRLANGVPPRLFGHHLGPTTPPPDGWPETPADYDEGALGVSETRFIATEL